MEDYTPWLTFVSDGVHIKYFQILEAGEDVSHNKLTHIGNFGIRGSLKIGHFTSNLGDKRCLKKVFMINLALLHTLKSQIRQNMKNCKL